MQSKQITLTIQLHEIRVNINPWKSLWAYEWIDWQLEKIKLKQQKQLVAIKKNVWKQRSKLEVRNLRFGKISDGFKIKE